MSGHRPFDDSRFPDAEAFADCFLCGKAVDPLDPKRGTYEEPPAGPLLPIHLPCASHLFASLPESSAKLRFSFLYHRAINEMGDRQLKIAGF